MVRILIETEAGAEAKVIGGESDMAGTGEVADGGAGPGNAGDRDALAASADGGGPPPWLTAAIAAAEKDGAGGHGDLSAPDDGGIADGGAGPQA